jgi:hypothetical protein
LEYQTALPERIYWRSFTFDKVCLSPERGAASQAAEKPEFCVRA